MRDGLQVGRDAWPRLADEAALDDLDLPFPVGRAVALGKHASTRSFYRLLPATEGGSGSLVLVVYPADDLEGVERYRRTAKWMAAAGVRVPRIVASGRHALLVEDGGDELLADLDGTPDEERRAYEAALETVVAIQRHGRRASEPNPGWGLDAERLAWELEFTERHALRGWLEVTGDAAARRRGFARLVDAVARLPTALCHRDFHARNLLVQRRDGAPGGLAGAGPYTRPSAPPARGRRPDDAGSSPRAADPPDGVRASGAAGRSSRPLAALIVLDFQDCMRGPLLYDVASLLWDNYRDVPEEAARGALERFWGCIQPAGLDVDGGAAVPPFPAALPGGARQAFCLVAAQRHLKALGTFGYQVEVAGRRGYARYAARTWRHARTALSGLGWNDLLAALRPVDEALAATRDTAD